MSKKIIFIIFSCCYFGVVIAQDAPQIDTIHFGGMTIVTDNTDTLAEKERKRLFKKLDSKVRPRTVKTEWMILDLGISNFVDNTVYGNPDAISYGGSGINEEWMAIKPFKSRNVNIWIVMQQTNLIRHYVNFKYGLGVELNNYHYKQPIRYTAQTEAVSNPQVIHFDMTADRVYKKNKLAADYLTVPLMLNFNFTPYSLYSFELSGGVSVGYLYSSRNKTITADDGKKKERGDFDLSPWKLSYVAEANLGFVTFYGSYAFKTMYKRGLAITPYNVGLRIRPVDLFNKIEPR